MNYTIKPKYGYDDVTLYPEGGCFCRTGPEGLKLHSVEIFPYTKHIHNAIGSTFGDAIGGKDRRIMFNTEFADKN